MSADRQVITTFKARASRAINNYAELIMAVHNKHNQASLESLLAEQLVVSVAVMWEAFITDLLVAYVTLDSTTSIKSLKSRIAQSISDKFGADAAKAISYSFPKKLTKARAAAHIDPKGWNVTLRSADLLSKHANDLLAAQYAKKFSLNADDTYFLDFVTSMRNYLSHRSNGSRQVLKQAISQAGKTNAFLVGTFTNSGAYLKSIDTNGNVRAVLMVKRLIQIADQL